VGTDDLIDTRLRDKPPALVHAARQKQLPNHRQTFGGDSKPTLWGEDRTIAAERIGFEVAGGPGLSEDRAIGADAAKIVARDIAVGAVERRGTGNGRVAAGAPVEAGVEAEGAEHFPLHQPVEALAARPLHHRCDHRESHIGIAKVSARPAPGIERLRIGQSSSKVGAERHDIIDLVPEARSMGEEQSKRDLLARKSGISKLPAEPVRDIAV
jgi:hypothetical protein